MRKEKGEKENIEKWKTQDFGRRKVEARFPLSVDLRSTAGKVSVRDQRCGKGEHVHELSQHPNKQKLV